MKFYFARHGQTDWNLQGRMQGSTDIPLNEKGIEQAELLSQKILDLNLNIGKVYTSHLTRAFETGRIVSKKLGVPIEKIPGLQEMCIGKWEGMLWTDCNEKYAEEIALWKENRRYSKIHGGENYQEVAQRIWCALEQIFSQIDQGKVKDKNVLIVTHGGCIKTLMCLIKEQDIKLTIDSLVISNGSIYAFDELQVRSLKEKLFSSDN